MIVKNFEKEELQKSNEEKEFHLYKSSRPKKNKENESNFSNPQGKFVSNNEKPEIDKYYQCYVNEQKNGLLSNQENLNKKHKERIDERIKQRECVSDIASKKAFQGKSMDKETLQKKNEEKDFYIYNDARDPGLIKLQDKKFSNGATCVNNSLINDKPEIDNYYKCYVNNKGNSNYFEKMGQNQNKQNMSSRDYYNDLNKQAQEKQDKMLVSNMKEQNAGLQSIIKNKKDFEKKQSENINKQQNLKEDFIKQNNELKEKKEN